MSTPLEADTPQGKTIEERVAATEQPAPQEEPQAAPAAVPTADEVSQDTENINHGEHEDTDLELPENASDRTKEQFEKLKRQLREERERNRQEQTPESIFDQIRNPQQATQMLDANNYAGLNQQQVDTIATNFVDADGNVDVQGLNQALSEANQRATRAEQRAQEAVQRITRYEMNREYEDALKRFPQLDPSSEQYDKDFYELVGDKYTMEKYGKGTQMTIKQAADFIAKRYRMAETEQKVKDQAVEDYKQAQEKRNQGPVEKGKGESRQALADHDELRQRSRRGDDNAIARRIDAATGGS